MRRRYLMEGEEGTLDLIKEKKKEATISTIQIYLFLYTSLGRIPRNQENEINGRAGIKYKAQSRRIRQPKAFSTGLPNNHQLLPTRFNQSYLKCVSLTKFSWLSLTSWPRRRCNRCRVGLVARLRNRCRYCCEETSRLEGVERVEQVAVSSGHRPKQWAMCPMDGSVWRKVYEIYVSFFSFLFFIFFWKDTGRRRRYRFLRMYLRMRLRLLNLCSLSMNLKMFLFFFFLFGRS